MIFGQFSTMRQKKVKKFNFGSNEQMHYADWIFNQYRCDCPHIYHWYICMSICCNREKILSNLFSQGIISNISWYGNVARVTKMWIFLHIEINPWKLALKVVILLLLIVLDKIVTISHMFGLFTPNHRVLNYVTRVTNVTRVTKWR